MRNSKTLKFSLLFIYCLSLLLIGYQATYASANRFPSEQSKVNEGIDLKDAISGPSQFVSALGTSKSTGHQSGKSLHTWGGGLRLGVIGFVFCSKTFFFDILRVALQFKTEDIAYSFHAFW